MDSGKIKFVFIVMAMLIALSAAKQRYRCRQGEEYFNNELKKCVPCSRCTDNTHPHRQCYWDQDTLCRPWKFGSFDFKSSLEQTNENSEPVQAQKTIDEPVAEVSQQTATTLLMADETSDEKWFTITMILAGILVIAITILLLLTCYMCKRKQREILYESSFAGALLGDDSTATPQSKVQLFKIVTET